MTVAAIFRRRWRAAAVMVMVPVVVMMV
jgi:hypothetical protein